MNFSAWLCVEIVPLMLTGFSAPVLIASKFCLGVDLMDSLETSVAAVPGSLWYSVTSVVPFEQCRRASFNPFQVAVFDRPSLTVELWRLCS